MEFVIFCLLFLVLFLISHSVTRNLSRLFLKLFHSQSVAVALLSFLFLPGVILHELSHLLMASILFVPTGEIEFLPEVSGNEVKMGSVAIAHTDPFRRFLIGVAPVIGGIGVILLVSFYLSPKTLSWQGVLLVYIIFQIANTFFSSKKDMEGALEVGVGMLILAFVLQILGVPVYAFSLSFLNSLSATHFFLHINMLISIAVGIDIFLVLLTRGILAFRMGRH